MISRPLKTIGRKINTVYGFRLYTYYLNEEFEDLLSNNRAPQGKEIINHKFEIINE